LLIQPVSVINATVDLRDYTQVDVADKISVNSTAIVFTGIRRDSNEYVYKDHLGAEIDDFVITFEFEITDFEGGDSSNRDAITLISINDALGNQSGTNEDFVALKLSQQATSDSEFYLSLVGKSGGVLSGSDSSTLMQVGTKYWVNFTRSGSTGTCKVYDDEWSNQLHSLSCSVPTDDFRYSYVIQGLGFDTDPNDYVSGYVKNIESDELEYSPDYVNDLDVTDMSFWMRFDYDSNVTGNHLMEVSQYESFSVVMDFQWSNATNKPYMYFNATDLLPNTTHYYRFKHYNETDESLIALSSGYNFTTSFDYSFMNGLYFESSKYYDSTGDSDDLLERHLSYDPVTEKWIISRGNKPNLYESKKFPEFEDMNITYSDTLDGGYSYFKNGFKMIKGRGGDYVIFNRGVNDTDTSTHWWNGSSLDNLTYRGIAIEASDITGLTVNCRLQHAHYNVTDDKYYGYIGGAGTSKGDWDSAWLVISDTPCFSSGNKTKLYEEGDFDEGAWCDSFLYPPRNMVWTDMGTVDQQGFGVVAGCGEALPPYAFSSDLIFPQKAIVSTDDFYTTTSSATTPYDDWFTIGGDFSLGITDIDRPQVIMDNDHVVWLLTHESENADYDANETWVNDWWVGQLHGFWLNEKIGVRKGYFPQNQYWDLPNETQFKAMLDARIYSEDSDINVTISEYDDIGSTFAVIDVDTSYSNGLLFDLDGLNNVTAYLHIVNVTGGYTVTINDDSTNANETLIPVEDQYTFSFNTGGGVEPFVDSVTLVSPDGVDLKYLPIVFSYTPSSDEALTSAELWVNKSGIWQKLDTDNSPTNGTVNTFRYNLTEAETYIWNVKITDASGSFWGSANNSFTLEYDYITAYTVNSGTIVSGDKNSTYALDGVAGVVAETTGAPAFDIDFNFTQLEGVVSEVDLKMCAYYDGVPTHEVYLQLYNHTSGSWDTVYTFTDGDSYSWINRTVVESHDEAEDYIPNTGGDNDVLEMRVYHPRAGNTNDRFYVDFIAIETKYNLNDVGLSHPIDDATSNNLTVDFRYIPYVYGTHYIIKSQLWTNETGSWGLTAENSTLVTNSTTNTITHTFSEQKRISWNIIIVTDLENYTHVYNRSFIMVLNTAPAVVSMEFTNLFDDTFVVFGVERVYDLVLVSSDAEGGSDVSSSYFGLQYGDSNVWINGTYRSSNSSLSITSGEDFIIVDAYSHENDGNNHNVTISILFNYEGSVDTLNGWFSVEDSSGTSSGWSNFPIVAQIRVYDGGGSASGSGSGTPSSEGEDQVRDPFDRLEPYSSTGGQEYLIEISNPLKREEIIKIIPIPWEWNRNQKMFVILISYFVILFSLVILLKKYADFRKQRKKKARYVIFNKPFG